MPKKRLGERLIEAGKISEEQLTEGLERQRVQGGLIGEILIGLGYLRETDLMRILCEDAGIPFLSLADADIDGAAARAIPEPLARRLAAVPLSTSDGRLTVALANPFDLDAVMALERATGRIINVAAAPRAAIERLLARAYRAGAPDERVLEEGLERGAYPETPPPAPHARASEASAPVQAAEDSGTAAQVVAELIRAGVVMGATDVHIEPARHGVLVRYRVDGLLREGPTYPAEMQPALVARVKILSGLNIAETRLPQDGRFRVSTSGRDIDLRVSTFPTLHGEDVVLRLLDRGRVELRLERLGMSAEDIALFHEVLARPHGLVAVTGPTGSGKTTTLYSALTELDTDERCVLTLEDPIEYELPGIRQSQVNIRAGLTFGSGLRSLLRHDPDVILVGEMRDQETVRIGLSAALTGHLVLTTLHTNTAAGAIPRLLDMDAEPFVLASSLELVVGQRLVRVLCRRCRGVVSVPDPVRRRLRLEGAEVLGPRGCSECRESGYKGRTGIFELLRLTPEIATAIHTQRSAEEIQRLSGRPTLLQAGLRKVREGITSLDEILRVTAA